MAIRSCLCLPRPPFGVLQHTNKTVVALKTHHVIFLPVIPLSLDILPLDLHAKVHTCVYSVVRLVTNRQTHRQIHDVKTIKPIMEKRGLLVTGWLTESFAYQTSLVNQISIVQLINCSMGYHHRLSGFISRAQNQPHSYKEDIANRKI